MGQTGTITKTENFVRTRGGACAFIGCSHFQGPLWLVLIRWRFPHWNWSRSVIGRSDQSLRSVCKKKKKKTHSSPDAAGRRPACLLPGELVTLSLSTVAVPRRRWWVSLMFRGFKLKPASSTAVAEINARVTPRRSGSTRRADVARATTNTWKEKQDVKLLMLLQMTASCRKRETGEPQIAPLLVATSCY